MKHCRLLALACAAGATLSPFSAMPLLAQADNRGLEEIVVTSSRIETPLRQIGTSVSVLTADDIQDKGSTSLVDILRTLPSVAVSNTGGSGQVSTLRIRGEEGYRTMVLLDGIKLSDPSVTQVGPQLEHLMTSGIERVELLRGPQGLSYGADAGGVLNISTQPGDAALGAHVDAMTGAHGTRQFSGNVSAGNETADFFIAGNSFETDGFNARTADSALRDDDGYQNTTLHARVGVNASENLRLELVLRDVAGETAYDSCFHPVTFVTIHDCGTDYDLQASRLAGRYQAGHGSHSLAYSTTETDRENLAIGASSYVSNGQLTRWEYVGNLTSLDGMSLVYGVDQEEEDNNGDSRDQLGYYLEYLSDFSEQFFITAGVRRDDNDDFGTHNSYRVSGAYLFDLRNSATLKFRGSYGTGFRAPSPYEAAYNRGAFASPPASLTILKEESSKGHEMAIEYYTSAGLHLEATWFDQQIEDAIYFDLAAFSGYLQDIGTSSSQGVELSATIPLSQQWTVDANYTHNKTRRPDGTQRQLRPRDLGNIALSWHSTDDRLKVSSYYRTSRNAVDALFGAPTPLEDYSVIDLTANYTLNDSVEIYGRMENLNDADHEEVLGYNTAGRSAWIGARFNLGSRRRN